jgi:hypothetical protein
LEDNPYAGIEKKAWRVALYAEIEKKAGGNHTEK